MSLSQLLIVCEWAELAVPTGWVLCDLKGTSEKKLKSDLNLKFFLNIFLISAQGMDLSLFFSDVMVSSSMGPLQKRFYLLGAYYDIKRFPPAPVVRLMGAGWANVITKLLRIALLSGVMRSHPSRGLVCLIQWRNIPHCEVTIPLLSGEDSVLQIFDPERTRSHQAINLTVVVSFTAITSTSPATL